MDITTLNLMRKKHDILIQSRLKTVYGDCRIFKVCSQSHLKFYNNLLEFLS